MPGRPSARARRPGGVAGAGGGGGREPRCLAARRGAERGRGRHPTPRTRLFFWGGGAAQKARPHTRPTPAGAARHVPCRGRQGLFFAAQGGAAPRQVAPWARGSTPEGRFGEQPTNRMAIRGKGLCVAGVGYDYDSAKNNPPAGSPAARGGVAGSAADPGAPPPRQVGWGDLAFEQKEVVPSPKWLSLADRGFAPGTNEKRRDPLKSNWTSFRHNGLPEAGPILIW